MVNESIKLQDNLSLYSGDIITINNSNPLLIEIIDDNDQTVKLRSVKKNKYLSWRKIAFDKSVLDFTTDFKNALAFTVKKNEDGEISLQTNNEYLESNKKNFYLSSDSSEKKWLVINKPKNSEKIADYEEIITISPHKEQKPSVEKLLIACEFYDNKSNETLKRTFEFIEERQNEHSLTCYADFTWGVSANLKLTPLKVVGLDIGGKFEEKFGTSNTIKETKKITIKENFSFGCQPWTKVQVKLEAKRIKTPYTAKIKRVIDKKNYEYLVDGEYSCDDYSNYVRSHEEIMVRNILLVGCTGSGKSTLAKVLSNDNRFEEGGGSVSKTKFFRKSEEFKWQEDDYCVIDNIGFGDTKVSEREELIRIGEAINSARQGLSHVLFVFGGRFSDKEKEGFQKLAALKITNSYLTLVRSKFDNFYNEDDCEEDKESLKNENPEISQVFDNCRGLLHIDNDDEDSRNDSREKVLNYLRNNCTNDPFKPKEWENIASLIEDYLQNKEKLVNEIKTNIDQKEAIEQQINILKTDTAEQVQEKIKEGEIREFIEVIEVANK